MFTKHLEEKNAVPSTAYKPLLNKPKLLAASLDFDFSLAYNLDKLRTLHDPREKVIQIIEDNRHLLKQLAAKAVLGNYDKVVLLTGTNRQSWADDFNCGFDHPDTRGSGSCFAVYPVLAAELEKEIANFKLSLQTDEMRAALGTERIERFNNKKITVLYDSILSADVTMNKNTCAKEAYYLNENPEKAQALFAKLRDALQAVIRNEIKNTDHFYQCEKVGFVPIQSPTLFDRTKISLLYLQMHRLAKYYSDHHIDFLFLDDSVEVILKPLSNFYFHNSSLIPPNVQLQLFPYGGYNANHIELNKEHLLASITPQTTNIIDRYYRENIILWWAVTLKRLKYDKWKKQYYFYNNAAPIDGQPSVITYIDPPGKGDSITKLRNALYKDYLANIIAIGQDPYHYTDKKAGFFKRLRLRRLDVECKPAPIPNYFLTTKASAGVKSPAKPLSNAPKPY